MAFITMSGTQVGVEGNFVQFPFVPAAKFEKFCNRTNNFSYLGYLEFLF